MYKQLSLFLLLSCIHLQYHAAQTVDLGNPYGEAILIDGYAATAEARPNNFDIHFQFWSFLSRRN